MSGDKGQGQISEWNEGDYKNLRLHKAQEIINAATLNPLKPIILFDMKKYGYEFWFDGINILFGEGISKYGETEVTEVEKIRDEIEELMEKDPAHKNFSNYNGQTGYSIHPDKWTPIKKKLREFEYKVKKYNDEHGLSTRNKDDDEGL